MPRKYKTKEGSKKRIPIDKEKLKNAVAAVIAGNTLKGTSKKNGVPLMTLKRYARRQKESNEEIQYEPNYKRSQIFTDEEEKELSIYLETASDIFAKQTPSERPKLHLGHSSNCLRLAAPYNCSAPGEDAGCSSGGNEDGDIVSRCEKCNKRFKPSGSEGERTRRFCSQCA